MRTSTKSLLSFLILMSLVVAQAVALPAVAQSPTTPRGVESIAGRWRVKFRFAGDIERNLIFEAKAKNVGSFSLLDSGPDNKPIPDLAPAVWSLLANERVSFTGQAEMPLGTCCREIGTLIFKGKFESNNTISGGLIFVTSVEEEESPYKYHSQVGHFTATRMN
jgi:hypothetical protein